MTDKGNIGLGRKKSETHKKTGNRKFCKARRIQKRILGNVMHELKTSLFYLS
jgi:hypothetical protein